MPFERRSYSLENNPIELDSFGRTECYNQIANISEVIMAEIDKKSPHQSERYNQTPNVSEDITDKNNKAIPRKKKNPFLGFFYILIFALHMSSFNVILKKLPYVSTGQLAFVRNAGAFVGSLPIAVACQKNILGEKKDRLSLIFRGFLGGTGIYLGVLTYGLLPLADAAIIISVTPVVTILFARIFLKESCTTIQSLCLLITLCGLFLSVRLPELFQNRSEYKFDLNYIGGLAAGVANVIVFSSAFIVVRKIRNVHFSIPTLYFGFFGMIESIIINTAMWSYYPVHCGWDQFLYFVLGILGFLGNVVFTLALQVEEAGIVAVVTACLDILTAMAFQTIFFNEYPDLYNVLGGFCIILSLSILGIRNWLLTLPENSKSRRKLKYFLI